MKKLILVAVLGFMASQAAFAAGQQACNTNGVGPMDKSCCDAVSSAINAKAGSSAPQGAVGSDGQPVKSGK